MPCSLAKKRKKGYTKKNRIREGGEAVAAKKPAENKELKELKRALEQGQPARLYIFHGPESYLREHYLQRLKKCILTGGMESFNYHEFQGKDLAVHQLIEAAEAFPMMSDRSLVLVHDYNLFQNTDRMEQLLPLIKELPDYLCLVFLYETEKWSANANTKLGKAIKANGQIVEFREQQKSDLNAWIRRTLKKRWDKEIDTDSCDYLTFLCGDLMANLSGELDKLGAYTKGNRVTRTQIDAVCEPVLEARAFQMTDAITAGDYDRALELLHELLRMGEEPIVILAALGRQLRQLWSARLAWESRRGAAYLADLWGMKSSWQADKLLNASRNYSRSWCRKAVKLTQEADWRMKSGTDSASVLVELVLTLAAEKKGR